MTLTAASPLGEAVYTLLQDATLQTALGGRLYDAVPADTVRPCALYEVLNERDIRGFGAGGLPEVDLRTHVWSDIGSMSEAQSLNRQIVALLKDAAVTVTGYAQAGRIVYRESVTLPSEILNGMAVHEVVSIFTVWVEEV
jgi:hypothetical protein